MALLSNLPDSSLSVSSELHPLTHSRLRNTAGAWTADVTAPGDIWIQADLGYAFTLETVAVQGHAINQEWVTSFSLRFGDVSSLYDVIDASGSAVVFAGNSDATSVVEHLLTGVRARVLRLKVHEYFGAPSLRWEVHGCLQGELKVVVNILMYKKTIM